MEITEQIDKFGEFFDLIYKDHLHQAVSRGEKHLSVNFSDISRFNIDLAQDIIENPEDTIRAAEIALEKFDIKDFRIRIRNLPKTQQIMIRDIRSSHLNNFIQVIGIIRQKSDVRPQVTSARFECPSCGNTLTVLQLDTKFREPTKCACGRKGKFKLLSKEMIDAQKIVLEESPEELEGSEQPKRLDIFLKADLVSPMSEKKTNPGSKNIVTGILKEVPIIARDGGKLTRFDLMLEANHVESVAEDFSELDINQEEIKEIKELSEDPKLYKKLVNSIAPSIYGHEKVKEALLLQLFGGVRKRKDDGSITRGDVHVLLIGDPGCIAGDSRVALYYKGMEKIINLGKEHLQSIKEIVTKIRKDSKEKAYDFATRFHYYKNQPVLKVMTETGKEIICTYNQPLLTKKGWKRADELAIETEIRVMPTIPNKITKLADTGFIQTKNFTGKPVAIPKELTPELAGLCGYIIGDGNIHPKGYRTTMYINEEELDLISKLKSMIQNTFNISPSISIKASSGTKTIDDGNGLLRQFVSTQDMHIIEINSRQVTGALAFLANKRVPQQIFKSPKNVVASFISWLFDADGCAFSKGRGRTSIQLKSSKIGLLKDVQLLLLYFGIQSRIIEDNLCIRKSRDMEIFAKHIGFNSEKKKKTLQQLIKDVSDKSHQQKRKSAQWYEKIASIQPAGFMDVYDFEVPKSHSFIANGIVCHNSGKSQMLKRVSIVAPKSRYVSGKGASAAGLTATVVKDEFLRGYALEAGALVLTNKGICCTTGDAEFITEDLKKIKFKDLFSGTSDLIYPKFRVLSYNENTGKIELFKIKQAFKKKNDKRIIKIHTRTGREIKLTEDNEILTIKNSKPVWVETLNIRTGEYVAVPKIIPGAGKDFNNANFAYVCGLIATDGHIKINNKHAQVAFYNSNKSIIEAYTNALNNLNISHNTYVQKSGRISESNGLQIVSKKDVHNVYNSKKEFALALIDFGIPQGDKSTITCLNNKILGYSLTTLASFMRGVFDGDGSVRNNPYEITITTGIYENAKLYQEILLRFGIVASVKKSIRSWHCDTRGAAECAKFFTVIGSMHPDKIDRLKSIAVQEYKDRLDVLPESQEYFRTLIRKYRGKLGKDLYRYFWNYSKDNVSPSIAMLKRLNKLLCDDGLSKKIDTDILWDKVVSLEEEDEEYVYDFTMEGTNNFLANSIIMHNCIDELDKMTKEDTSAMHEALEQQTVSINKANISATLRAETTVLAAANPKFGRFDPYELIPKQIDLPSTLINRFDLIFPIRDIPNKAKDEKTAEFILQLHQKSSGGETDIPTSLLKKYIAYSKQNINPAITDSALEELKEYYVKMRSTGEGEEGYKSIPISARQLEALIRLSEASARSRLSDKVTKLDAKKAIELVHFCLSQIGVDPETGRIDIDRITTGITASQRGTIATIKEIIYELETQIGKQIPVDDVVMRAKDRGIDQDRTEEILDRLKKSGDIFAPRSNFISRI
ncbi:TPA: hypothetical protein HA235_00010 [Candidatus Woesearchaeota archaeon]|nr:hypothetical protein [Candidatus Woesearchaeota archaeon]HIJ13386.1 hypothetical protein [Candidatus Woesearchaeota archaeon]